MARRLRLRLEKRLNRLESAVRDSGLPHNTEFSGVPDPEAIASILDSLIEAMGVDEVRALLPEDLHDYLRPMLDQSQIQPGN